MMFSNFTRLPDISGVDEPRSLSPDVALARSGHKTVKDYERHLKALENANFELKLRVHMLEERLQQQDSPERAQEMVVNLKVQLGEMREDMAKKRALLLAAREAIDSLERQCQTESAQLQQHNQRLTQENQQLTEENRLLTQENQMLIEENHHLQKFQLSKDSAVSCPSVSSPHRPSLSDDCVQQLQQQTESAQEQARQLRQQLENFREEAETQRVSNTKLKSQLSETVAMLKQAGEKLSERTASLVEARGREGRLVRQLKEQHASRCRLGQWLQQNLTRQQLEQVPAQLQHTDLGQVSHPDDLQVKSEHEAISSALLSPPLSADCETDPQPTNSQEARGSASFSPPSLRIEPGGDRIPSSLGQRETVEAEFSPGGEEVCQQHAPTEEGSLLSRVPSGDASQLNTSSVRDNKQINQCFSPVVINTTNHRHSTSLLGPVAMETDVAVLRRCLANSRRSCQLLQSRLSELSDFLERLLRMEEDGLLDLSSVLSLGDRSELHQSLIQCREHALMPAADAQLADADLSTAAALAAVELSRRASLLPPQHEVMSESESWSEPDRSVSLARIGVMACGDVRSMVHQEESTTGVSERAEHARSKHLRRRRTIEYRNDLQQSRRRSRRHCSDAGIQTDLKFSIASYRSSSLGRREGSVKQSGSQLQQLHVEERSSCIGQSEVASPESCRQMQSGDQSVRVSGESHQQLLPLRREQFRQLAEQCQQSSRRRLQHTTSLCQRRRASAAELRQCQASVTDDTEVRQCQASAAELRECQTSAGDDNELRQRLAESEQEVRRLAEQLTRLHDKYQLLTESHVTECQLLQKQAAQSQAERDTAELSRQQIQQVNEQISRQLSQLHATNETLSADAERLHVEIEQAEQQRHLDVKTLSEEKQVLVKQMAEQKQQLMNQVDQLNQEKQQLMNQVDQLNQEKQQLMNKIDLLNQDNKHLMIQIDELERDKQQLIVKLGQKDCLIKEIDHLNQEKQELMSLINQLNQDKKELTKQVDQLHQDNQQLASKLNQDNQKMTNQIDELNQDKKQLINHIDELNQDKQQLMNQIDEVNQGKKQLMILIDELNQVKQQLMNQIDELNQDKKQLMIQIDGSERDKQQLIMKLGQKDCLTKEIDHLNNNKQQLTNQVNELSQDKQQLIIQVNKLNEDKQQLINQVNRLNQDKQILIADLDDVKLSSSAEHDRLREDVRALNTANTELKDRLDSLKIEVKSASREVPAVSAEDSDGMSSHTSADLGIESDMVRRLAIQPSTSRHSKGQDMTAEFREWQKERELLLSQLAETRQALKHALEKQARADQRKVRVEKAICRQLTKTHDILQRAKSNLSAGDPPAAGRKEVLLGKNQEALRKVKTGDGGDKENLVEPLDGK